MKFLLSQLPIITPSPIVECFANKYSPRSVLDVGTGSGRNAIYLAEKGFMVTAIDSEEESIGELQEFLKTNPLTLVAEVWDLKTKTPVFSECDTIIFSNILHYFKYQRGQFLLQQAMSKAKVGDVHVISAMTTVGDFYQIQPNAYYPKPNELKTFYEQNNWQIIEYSEREGIARAKKQDGTAMKNLLVELVVEKLGV